MTDFIDKNKAPLAEAGLEANSTAEVQAEGYNAAKQKTTDIPNADGAAIAEDIRLLHRLAGNNGGKLILAAYGQNIDTGKDLSPRVLQYDPGQHEAATQATLSLGNEPHRNVYHSFAIMSDSIKERSKGTEKDVVAVFGLVADFDAKDDPNAHKWAERVCP